MSTKFNSKIINGSLWSLIGSSGYQLFGLVIFVLLSRILSPVDFGTAALAIVFVELANVITRFGLVEVVVRTAKIDAESVNNDVFITTLGLGLMISALFLVAAPFLESFFETPGLAVSLQLLSIVPFMQGLSTVPEGTLRRDFKFKALAIRVLGSSVVAGIVAILLAFYGFGFYSLIIQRMLSTAFSLFLVWRNVAWRPKAYLSYQRVVRSLQQGLPIMLSALIGQGIYRFVELIIGFFLGPVALGYYKIAGKLFDVIVQFTLKPIVEVSYSAFSKLKDSPIKLENCYFNFIRICSIFSFPAFVGVIVVGPEAVALFFGEKWQVSGQIIQILCISGFSATLNWFFGSLCNATDNSSIPFKIRIFEFCFVFVLVSICSQYSIYYVVIANVLVTTSITIVMIYILNKIFEFSVKRICKQLLPPLFSAILMGIIVFVSMHYLLNELNLTLKLICTVALGVVSYPLIYWIFFQKNVSVVITSVKRIFCQS